MVGGGNAWQPVSTWLTLKYGPESLAVDDVDGRCSCRKFGNSTTVSESRRFLVVPTVISIQHKNNFHQMPNCPLRFNLPTLGGGGGVTAVIVESRRPLR